MSNRSNSEQSKTVVDACYHAGVESRLREFARYLHPDFTTTAPNYLPWGGFHPGAAFFRDEVLSNLNSLRARRVIAHLPPNRPSPDRYRPR